MLTEPVTTVAALAEVVEPPALQVTAEPRFDFFGGEYGRLFESSDATAFQHPLWLNGLYRNLAPPLGAEPLVITLRDGATGRLAAVVPLVRRKRGLLRMVEFADFGLSDYAGPVCGRDEWNGLMREPTASGAMLRALRPFFDLLRIAKLREDGLDLRPLLGSASQSVMPAAAHDVRGTRLQAVGPR